jgi:hypothetical protein
MVPKHNFIEPFSFFCLLGKKELSGKALESLNGKLQKKLPR